MYDVEDEKITKMQSLQQRLDVLTRDHDVQKTELNHANAKLNSANAILHMFANGTDQQATEALARLRIGDQREDIVTMPTPPESTLYSAQR